MTRQAEVAARVVVIMTCAAIPELPIIARVDAPLKPYHPIQRMKVPRLRATTMVISNFKIGIIVASNRLNCKILM